MKFHQVFTGWKWKVCRITWNKTFAEGLQLIENNVCKKYFNSNFHRLIAHLQINIPLSFYSHILYFFSELPLYVWPIFHRYTFASWTETLAPSLVRAFCLISCAHLHFLCFKIIWLPFLHKHVSCRRMRGRISSFCFSLMKWSLITKTFILHGLFTHSPSVLNNLLLLHWYSKHVWYVNQTQWQTMTIYYSLLILKNKLDM